VRSLVNVIAFQIGWFAAVLGAGHGMPWLGMVVVPLVLGLHLLLSTDRRPEFMSALAAALTGFVFDTTLIWTGVFSPVFFLFPAPLSPPWMVMLWINFATTLNVSLRSLHGRYALAAVLGAVGGPMAYASGAKLGAMTRNFDVGSLTTLAVAWAAAVPFLFLVSARITSRFGR